MPGNLSKMYKIHAYWALSMFNTQLNGSLWSNDLWFSRLLTRELIQKLYFPRWGRRRVLVVNLWTANFWKQEVTQESTIASVLDTVKWNNLLYSVRNANLKKVIIKVPTTLRIFIAIIFSRINLRCTPREALETN